MELRKQQRRVIADAIGLLQNEAALALADLYRQPTFENLDAIIQRLEKRMSFLTSAVYIAHYNELNRLDGFAGFRRVSPEPTELEKDLEERS